MNDLKFAFRRLLKNSRVTDVAVLTLGLGIGTNMTTGSPNQNSPCRFEP